LLDSEPLSLVALREAGGGDSVPPPPPPDEPRPQRSLRRLWWPGAAVAGVTLLAGAVFVLAPSGRPALGRPRPAVSPSGGPSAARPAPAAVAEAASGPIGGPIPDARFAPGACVVLPPTGADRHQTVFLDAGHGGPDPGTIGITQGGHAVDESALTLSTALAAAPLLRGQGYRVVLSRTGNSTVGVMGAGDLLSGTFTGQGALKDLTARAACANLARAAALVSIHYNAGGSPANAGMVTIYDDVRPFSARSLRLASLLQTEILASMNGRGWGIPDSGVRNDASAGGPAIDAADRAYGRLVLLGPAAEGYLATPSEMPGAVVEPLFITDPFEASIAAGAPGQQAIAAGIVRAVDTFLQPTPSNAP
jgi:N-acetylmuramoyl-L-alanine amidase